MGHDAHKIQLQINNEGFADYLPQGCHLNNSFVYMCNRRNTIKCVFFLVFFQAKHNSHELQ